MKGIEGIASLLEGVSLRDNTSDVESEDDVFYPNEYVIFPADDRDRMYRASILKNLFLHKLFLEKARVIEEERASTLFYIDAKSAELYLFLQKSVRSHNLLRKEDYNPYVSKTCLELVEHITDRIFFFLKRLSFVHKRLLNKKITINGHSIDKLYDKQSIRIERCMEKIVDTQNDDILIDMERDPCDAYQSIFSLYQCHKSKYLNLVKPVIDRVNKELSNLRTLAEMWIDQTREMISWNIAKASRAISRPFLLRDLMVIATN